MIEQLKNEKPVVKFFVMTSIFIMGIIIIFSPLIVMEKLIVTKFNLSLYQYLIVRTLEILYSFSLFIFGAYGGYIAIRKFK